MQTITVDRIGEIIKNKDELEKKLRVSISVLGKKVSFEGESLEEYEAGIILDAISFGFSAKKALLLLNPENIFKRIKIKGFTKRTLESTKSRLIGLHGKTKHTLEEVGDCDIMIGDSEVGIIGTADSIEKMITAITRLIKGSKPANVYYFLERMNAARKHNTEISTFKNTKRVNDDGEAK